MTRIFCTNKVYTEELTVAFGALSQNQLAEILRDGRASAFLVYEHLLARYANLKRSIDPQYPADCVALPGKIILWVRMVTANGVLLNLHRGNGTRRHFNKLEHLEVRKRVDGYLLVDVTNAPQITYAFVSKDRVPESNAKCTCDEGQGLISLATLITKP